MPVAYKIFLGCQDIFSEKLTDYDLCELFSLWLNFTIYSIIVTGNYGRVQRKQLCSYAGKFMVIVVASPEKKTH